MRVYVAAPLHLVELAQSLAETLVAEGHVVCSRWHSTVLAEGIVADSLDDVKRGVDLQANRRDLRACEAVVALTHVRNSRGPQATLVEMGEALALGRRILWVQHVDGTGRNLYDVDPLVTRIPVRIGPVAADVYAALRDIQSTA